MSHRWTVGALIEARARVVWRCEVCQALGDLDLVQVAAAIGPEATLTNRRPPCRRCPGRVRFENRTGFWPLKMDTLTDRNPAWWAYNEQERARLKALGWRIERSDINLALPSVRRDALDLARLINVA